MGSIRDGLTVPPSGCLGHACCYGSQVVLAVEIELRIFVKVETTYWVHNLSTLQEALPLAAMKYSPG